MLQIWLHRSCCWGCGVEVFHDKSPFSSFGCTVPTRPGCGGVSRILVATRCKVDVNVVPPLHERIGLCNKHTWPNTKKLINSLDKEVAEVVGLRLRPLTDIRMGMQGSVELWRRQRQHSSVSHVLQLSAWL